MNPTIIFIAEALIKYGPKVARELAKIFKKPDPTLDDWEKVFDLAEKSFDDYIAPKE